MCQRMTIACRVEDNTPFLHCSLHHFEILEACPCPRNHSTMQPIKLDGQLL